MIGQLVLNRYRVVRLLDQGGMSNIYLARDQQEEREVVVKGLQPQLATSKTRDHFRREVHIMSRFQHSNAAAYFDSDMEHPQGPLIVMEYLRGLDLHALIHQQGRFSLEYAGLLLMQLCEVLQSAHDAGMVHRDLKPGNLMIVNPRTPQCMLKLMDFGLAKMTSLLYIAPDEVFDYQLPPTAGTPEYIAPEQVRNSEMDHRGDLYSVGVILFEMLTGRRPFMGKTPQELMLAHMQEQPPSLTACGLREPVPLAMEKLIQDCLAKHPEARPSSAVELATRFEMALGRRLPGVRGVTTGQKPTAPAAQATPPPIDRDAFQHQLEATMPDSMALVKLKGFIFDLGGEVVESIPGMIRVRLGEQKKTSLFPWTTSTATPASYTDLELRTERPDPAQPSRLTVTLVMRTTSGRPGQEWEVFCQKIARDLQAYLIGR